MTEWEKILKATDLASCDCRECQATDALISAIEDAIDELEAADADLDDECVCGLCPECDFAPHDDDDDADDYDTGEYVHFVVRL